MDNAVYLTAEKAAALGGCAYMVGGCVRDSLLDAAPQDWDICTSAKPEEIIACFSGYRTILTGVRYGTVTVLSEGEAFEVTTFREECGYSDSRHPDEVRFLSSLRGEGTAKPPYARPAQLYRRGQGAGAV